MSTLTPILILAKASSSTVPPPLPVVVVIFIGRHSSDCTHYTVLVWLEIFETGSSGSPSEPLLVVLGLLDGVSWVLGSSSTLATLEDLGWGLLGVNRGAPPE